MERRPATASLLVAPLVPMFDHLVMIAAGIEVALEGVGVGLSGLKTIARGNAVAVTDQQRPVGGRDWAGEEEQPE